MRLRRRGKFKRSPDPGCDLMPEQGRRVRHQDGETGWSQQGDSVSRSAGADDRPGQHTQTRRVRLEGVARGLRDEHHAGCGSSPRMP
jgi:hypothetical protein